MTQVASPTSHSSDYQAYWTRVVAEYGFDSYCAGLSAAFGTTFKLTSTGGHCIAIEAALENGWSLLITDAADSLSPLNWHVAAALINDPFGFACGVYVRDEDGADEPIEGGWFENHSAFTIEDMIAVVRTAIDNAKSSA